MPRSEAAIEALAEDFARGFRDRIGPLRRVGIEAEFPLVDGDGRAGDLHRLWPSLLQDRSLTPEFDDPEKRSTIVAARRPGVVFAAEVGRATLELSLGPFDDLWGLDAALRAALEQAGAAAAGHDLTLLGFGIQPRTPPSAALMTPRRHYRALLGAVGKAWLPLTTTASTQLHVDIARSEVTAAVNVMNLLSGVLIAVSANSSVYAGRASATLAGRESLLAALGEHRYGMTPRRLPDVQALVSYLADFPCFVLRRNARFPPVRTSFRIWLGRHGPSLTRAERLRDFLWHEHYVWNSARARSDHSTIEVRPACQQPPGALLAPHALSLGWTESLPEVEELLTSSLGPDPWPALIAYRREAIRSGLRASPPTPTLLRELLAIARRGLARRGRHEEAFLAPAAERIARRESPADVARRLVQRGMPALLRTVRIAPAQTAGV